MEYYSSSGSSSSRQSDGGRTLARAPADQRTRDPRTTSEPLPACALLYLWVRQTTVVYIFTWSHQKAKAAVHFFAHKQKDGATLTNSPPAWLAGLRWAPISGPGLLGY